jgi:putative transcriptional regulator
LAQVRIRLHRGDASISNFNINALPGVRFELSPYDEAGIGRTVDDRGIVLLHDCLAVGHPRTGVRTWHAADQSCRGHGVTGEEPPRIVVKLDDLLHARQMTLTELAERVDITLANLSILKTGKAKAIRFSTLEAICRELGCQPGDLLGYADAASC